jgi:hypothetical protein
MHGNAGCCHHQARAPSRPSPRARKPSGVRVRCAFGKGAGQGGQGEARFVRGGGQGVRGGGRGVGVGLQRTRDAADDDDLAAAARPLEQHVRGDDGVVAAVLRPPMGGGRVHLALADQARRHVAARDRPFEVRAPPLPWPGPLRRPTRHPPRLPTHPPPAQDGRPPTTLVANMLRQLASSVASGGCCSPRMPALATRTSSRPWALVTPGAGAGFGVWGGH